jgi:REP element-mobilizing transposase RayT
MPYRKTLAQPDCYYHIYNRGVDRRPIFFCSDNWRHFLVLLRRYFVPSSGQIVAYCLMPNHYHLLVRVLALDFAKDVMQPFGVSYTKGVNLQQSRVGPIFQGPYRSVAIESDDQLLHLSRYIHLNPVRAGLVTAPEDWPFSSYREYVGLRTGTLPEPSVVLGQFSGMRDYAQFVNAYLDTDKDCIANLLLE